MPLTIRPAAPADAAFVVEFNRLLAWETEGKALEPTVLAAGVAAALADPLKARYFVAEENGDVVGQIMITTEWSDWRNGWMWWIQSVYVGADRRGRGVFRALYEHVEALARNDPDVIGLRLYVEHENRAAQETYRKLGMDMTGYRIMERSPIPR